MKWICQLLGAVLMTSGLEPAAASHGPTGTCPSIGAVETQFSSTCDSCVVTDGTKTIDQDETTYGTLQIVGAGSGTMRATAQGGVVFPAGSQVGIQHSIFFNGDVEMLLRTYEKEVLQEEFAIEDYHSPISFKTTRPYDAVEFGVSQFDPAPIHCGYALPTPCQPSPHEVEARIHEFCTGPDTTPDPFTADVTPEAFAFSDQPGVEPGATVTSDAVTIAGIEAPASISVTGGEYSIGCTASFTSAGGTIANDETVCVRHTAAGTHGTATDTTLTVGGISDTFTSTTAAAPAAPVQGGGGGAPSPWVLGVLAAVATLRRRRSADPGSAATEESRRRIG